MSIEFIEFGKIARLSRNCTITEKIDGTNACVCIVPYNGESIMEKAIDAFELNGVRMVMLAGSRTRWITPQDDNYGFAKWAFIHAGELRALGEGRHFGEWWGQGVQRNYGMKEKRFSLFNTSRWSLYGHVEMEPQGGDPRITPKLKAQLPQCCSLVPVLYSGIFTSTAVDDALWVLKECGSAAAPGFMKPEGVVVYQQAGRVYFKKTIEKDDEPKGKTL